MPNLEEFKAGTGEISIPDRGAETFAQAGRRAGLAYRQVGEDIDRTVTPIGQQVIQHQQDLDISNIYSQMSNAKINALTNWQTASSQQDAMNHPEMGKAFLDEYTTQLQNLADSAHTQAGKILAMRLVNAQREEMFSRVAADMSDLTAAKYIGDRQNVFNNTAAAMVSDPSPDNIAANIGMYDQFASDHIPSGVTAAVRERLMEQGTQEKQQLVEAAFRSAIHKGEQQIASGMEPKALDTLQQMIDSGQFNNELRPEFSGDLPALMDEARTRGASQLRVAQAAQKEQTVTNTEAQIAKIRTQLLPDANGNPPSAAQRQAALSQLTALANSSDPVVSATAGRAVESIGAVTRTQAEDTLSGKFTQDDPAALTEINQRKALPPNAPGSLTKVELDDMRAAGRLSDKTYQEQTRRLEDLTSNPALREQEARLTAWFHGTIRPKLTQSTDTDMAGMPPGQAALFGSLSKTDPKGDAAAGIALNQTIAQYEYMVNQGRSPEEAYTAVTDPNSPNSVWHVMQSWEIYAKQGPEYAAQHPITYGHSPFANNPTPAGPAPQTVDERVQKVQATGPIKPGESWTAYKARAGIQ